VIEIETNNRQTGLAVDASRLEAAVRAALEDEPLAEARISLAVVDDPTIHALNRRYLDHDEPTDVLSFVLERDERSLEAEIVVSADTARRSASRFGWSAADELLLYVVHGALHAAGYDDRTPAQRAAMRGRERACLARFGLEPPYDPVQRGDPRPDSV
jgi:probable rRNA maturation factor